MAQEIKAELSSLEFSLGEIAKRIAALADQKYTEKQEAIASELYQAERSILSAVRRLEKAQNRQ